MIACSTNSVFLMDAAKTEESKKKAKEFISLKTQSMEDKNSRFEILPIEIASIMGYTANSTPSKKAMDWILFNHPALLLLLLLRLH